MADNTVEYKIKLKGEGADSVDKLKHLVETVYATDKTVMGAPPEPAAKFGVIAA